MPDDVAAFVLHTLTEMNFDTDGGVDSQLGPRGIDLDSLSVVELAARVSSAYGIKLTGQDMEQMAMATVREFAAEIVRRRASAVPADSTAQ